MMNIRFRKIKIFTASLALNFIFAQACRAQLLEGINCIEKGDCQLNDIMRVAIKLAEWIWGISGSLALLFFIYGGFTFLISGGQTDKINQGKEILKNSLIGLIVIFVSYAIVSFVIYQILGAKGDWSIVGGLGGSSQ